MIHQNHRIRTAVAVALATAAVAPAGASAMLSDPPQPKPSPSPRPVIIRESGFDWGDAGIGAAGMLGLSMLAAGGIVLVSRRHPHGPTGATS